MTYEVEYVDDAGYVSGTLTGDLEQDELNAARGEMNALLMSNKCKRLLVDATDVLHMQSVFSDFEFTAEHQTELPLGTSHAVVVQPEHMEHMQFVEDVAQNRSVNLRLFTDKSAAIDWLLLVGTSPSSQTPSR